MILMLPDYTYPRQCETPRIEGLALDGVGVVMTTVRLGHVWAQLAVASRSQP
jgi:hypothetical protein